MHVVALALSDGVPIYELAAPCAIFGMDRPRRAADWYDFRVCSPRNARVDKWFRAVGTSTYADLAYADTVVVPACHDGDLCPPPALVAAVRAAHARGARIVSICTGAFVLAEAGILDGRRAATHWMHARTLAERYPAVSVDPDVLYVDDGQVLTSAGKSAGTDLCLHVVRRDHGTAVANSVARRLVTPPHRDGGQAQFIVSALPKTSDDDFGALLSWTLDHLHEPLGVDQLAARAHVTGRTLNRRFRATVGASPQQWLHGQRLQRARELLEGTDLGVEAVATRSGFGSANVLRRHFRHTLDTTPDAYRRSFASREG